ncbi:hypothetical protein GCM10027418_29250 [Mariniluteicoccus endophyticus]
MASTPASGAVVRPYAGSAYPQILHAGLYSPLLGLLGFAFGVSAWIFGGALVSELVLRAAHALGHRDVAYADFARAARGYEHWEGMLASHASLALLIPISWLLLRTLHQMPGRWLLSVWGRVRWRYLAVTCAASLVVFSLYIASMPLRGQPLSFHPQPGFWSFLVMILLTSPLQAVAEEFFFRGYLLQAFGGVLRTPWFGIITSALVFALFHGSQNAPLFTSRFVFGLLAAWLVVRTGGLEAGIAAHVVNNVFAFTLAGLTTTIAAARQAVAVGWAQAFGDVVLFAVFALVAALIARAMQVPTTVPERLGAPEPADLPNAVRGR